MTEPRDEELHQRSASENVAAGAAILSLALQAAEFLKRPRKGEKDDS